MSNEEMKVKWTHRGRWFAHTRANPAAVSVRPNGCGSPQPPFQRIGDSNLPSAVGPQSFGRYAHQHDLLASSLHSHLHCVSS
jgi:hypothetical protein